MLDRKKSPRQKTTTSKRFEESDRCSSRGQPKRSKTWKTKTIEKNTLLKKEKETRDVNRGRNECVQKSRTINEQRKTKQRLEKKSALVYHVVRRTNKKQYWKKEEKWDVKDGDMNTKPTNQCLEQENLPTKKGKQRKEQKPKLMEGQNQKQGTATHANP